MGVKNYLFLFNKLSGNYNKLDCDKIINSFGDDCQKTVMYITTKCVFPDFSIYDKIVVCGGDGTLNGVLNSSKKDGVEIIYIPSGTFNEYSKFKSRELMCTVNNSYFSYVLACGTFTPLGYNVQTKQKKKFKIFAYWFNVIKEYKLYNINAQIQTPSRNFDGDFTLIMCINAPRCFGFNFNKLYHSSKSEFQLLLIKSPKGNKLCAKFKIFFYFFRAFFIGFKKEYHSKHIDFLSLKSATINLSTTQTFNIDGEKIDLCATNTINIATPNFKLYTYNNH